MVRNIQEIKNPGASNHFEQLVPKCLSLLYIVGSVLEGYFFLHDVIFFLTLMANYDNFLHANTALNWLPRSIMCVGPRKSKFWTRCIRFSTWKPPVNRGDSRFSKKFSSFDNLFFAQEIVCKPSVILLLCLSHLWKLLVPLSWPFSVFTAAIIS